jgi:hypothetical protein
MAATLGPLLSQKPVCFSGSEASTQVSLEMPPSCADTICPPSSGATRARPPGMAT